MRKSFQIVIVLVLLPSVIFARYRAIDVTAEIKNAKYVGEIVFSGYDSVKICKSYYTKIDSITKIEYKVYFDSVWNIQQIYYKKSSGINDSVFQVNLFEPHPWIYYLAPPVSLPAPPPHPSHGFWPRIGDTCLIVIDSLNRVSLFAMLVGDKYVFWDPYPNSGWVSIFAFSSPFEHFSKPPESNFEIRSCDRVATRFGRESAAFFHCAIKQEEFWNEVMTEE